MQKLFFLLVTTFILSAPLHGEQVLTSLAIRSQERHRPEQLGGLCDSTYLLDAGPFYGTASLTASYAQTFKADHIAHAFFGPALFCADHHDPYIKIQGNIYNDDESRDQKALFADYFYLPQDYSSKIFFNPVIKNYSADIDLYFGLNTLHDGLYLRIHSPLVHTQWNLDMRERIVTPGSIEHPAGYFSPNNLTSQKLLSHFSQYSSGHSPAQGSLVQRTADIETGIFDNNSDQTFTILFNPLRFSQLSCATQTKTRLGDIRIELGKIIAESEDYGIGIHLECAIPTGTKKEGHFLFEPCVGNGDHWEFGGGVHGHYEFYKSRKINTVAFLFIDFTITHLFKTNQKRTFDLKNKPLSRYMLAARFTPAVTDLFAPQPLIPEAQFANEYTPVANISTLDVSVCADIQIDSSAYIHYQKKQWDFDFGYNLWYRSKEQIKCRQTASCCNDALSICDPQSKNRWALKGDAVMYGFNFDADVGLLSVVPLSATEHNATIYQGTNKALLTCATKNSAVDNPAIAMPNPPSGSPLLPCPTSGMSINTSNDLVFITCSDLAIQGSRGLSHTVFAHTSYMGQWGDYNPYFGIGGCAEFGMHNKDNTTFSLSQWKIWIKSGFAFD
jgi:hypothetical protein